MININRILMITLGMAVICKAEMQLDWTNMAVDYFRFKGVTQVCYITCESAYKNKFLVAKFASLEMRSSVLVIGRSERVDLNKLLHQWKEPVGVLLLASCENSQSILHEASQLRLFDASHPWLVISNSAILGSDTSNYNAITSKVSIGYTSRTEDIESFRKLNLSVNTDVVIAVDKGNGYELLDVFNFGKIQGNDLEVNSAGTWNSKGLNITMHGYKYYHRWDFHNLTLRAVTVVKGMAFHPSVLTDLNYAPGVAKMTKVPSLLLHILIKEHNFRFNYTLVTLWIGSPERNSTPAITNTLFWREQDLSCTSARIYPQWLEWVDPFLPSVSTLETKFYYLIPESGTGDFENRFLTPLSWDVWVCACAAAVACALVLTLAATVEARPDPGLYALFSVVAASCQQAYDEGFHVIKVVFSSQGRRLTLLVLGLSSMLLYNYYTSSVVSWLLSAAVPTIAGLDGLLASNLELTFEPIGYTTTWLVQPGFYYYSGFKNPKEDELREKKVRSPRRTVDVVQTPEDGIELVRKGGYAYHTEPYTASHVISRTFLDREICSLGALQMIPRRPIYILAQKQSPYKEFFSWSLMRLLERGHTRASQIRVGGQMPACSGKNPRALSLGQAAPAFALLVQAALLSLLILAVEILWHRIQRKKITAPTSILERRNNSGVHKKTIKGRCLTRALAVKNGGMSESLSRAALYK